MRSNQLVSHTCLIVLAILAGSQSVRAAKPIDFNRDIRSILSNKCLQCHGPDGEERQAGLRLDTQVGANSPTDSGEVAIVPGKPDESELIARIASDDESDQMPPADSGKKLSAEEIQLLTDWVAQGAVFSAHWSYVKPVRPELPLLSSHEDWPRNAADHYVLARLLREKLAPSPEADRYALVRRLSLDLTGLPPTIEEVDQFVNDMDAKAYENLVDRLLEKKTYGEHWARLWLDLARYADSAGYADDPARTIWGFRDYVIRSLNSNKPFDQFTIEQIAGDLLPNPTNDQLIATAFHRNTLTNNEGGTNDEEFRNVAIVDRVNTTMAVWMGTTIACAQCHTHKFDPITQEEYFRFFAIFNDSEDADRRDESPLVEVWSDEQQQQKTDWQAELENLVEKVKTATPELLAAQIEWENPFASDLAWEILTPEEMSAESGAKFTAAEDNSISVEHKAKTDVYELTFGAVATSISALRLEALADDSLPNKGPGHAWGNFVVSRVLASLLPPNDTSLSGRYVRIDLPGDNKMLSLAEVQVFRGADNIAVKGQASQSSTAYAGPAELAIDGNTNGDYTAAKSTTHTEQSKDPWWEVDLKEVRSIDRVVVWNRTDGKLQSRLNGFRVSVLDADHKTIWEQTVAEAPASNSEYSLSGIRAIPFATAFADHAQASFEAQSVINNKDVATKGWAIGKKFGKDHALTLLPAAPVEVPAGSKIRLIVEQLSQHENHTLGRFRVSVTTDPRGKLFAETPAHVLAILKTPADARDASQQQALTAYYLGIAPGLKKDRDRLVAVKKQLADTKPYTTVPVMRDLPDDKRRTTKIQLRGNFLQTSDEVTAGLPAAFHDAPEGEPVNRLALAKWLVDEDNPLTARVIANRYWEAILGSGIVPTSEEFGSQGELPTNPELLDWLATELIQLDWDLKAFVKLLVSTAAYRQSSAVTPELYELDPDNLLLARGPRFRLSAEMIRDQSLFASGLLSDKMYGPPAKPPQPNIGLSAAFGGGIDWTTSEGDDRYRRGLYTTWRRSNPYPSMAAFDAPNREVCTIKRDRTNTPLQALVTLNDPVYIEAAQALARRINGRGGTPEEKAIHGFRLCLARPPSELELSRLVDLYELAYADFKGAPEQAMKMATDPLGAAPEGSDVIELAAWTVVGNVLLNLDEMFLKR